MQKPLQLSDEMKLEIENEITALAPGQNEDDVTRYIPRPKGLHRGPVDLLPGAGLSQGPQDDKEMSERPLPPIAEDPINPAHYRSHPSGIECIEVTRHMNFNIGNAVKYIWRAALKGSEIEDLKKAQWYLDDEIRRLEGKR